MYKEDNNDILRFLENLSNQEVSTPIEVVNKMLDMLPQEIWSDKNSRFLDPSTKNGEFLREITKRLYANLAFEIPDWKERIEHILSKQVFGIAISYLTHLVSKRTLYCSLKANSKYSYARDIFDNEDGHILFDVKLDHEYKNGECVHCGVREGMFADPEKERYAYWFIHHHGKNIKDRIRKEFGEMKFDVIIGNPPYQMKDGGGIGGNGSATALYHKFVQTAIELEPKYLAMIIPSRWYRGGKGVGQFRKDSIIDRRYKEMHHFNNAKDCFPAVEIKGGVNYFLWDKNHNGKCEFSIYENKKCVSKTQKYLDEDGDIILTDLIGISVINKVKSKATEWFKDLVQARNVFSIPSSTDDLKEAADSESSVKTIALEKGQEKYSVKYYSQKLMMENFSNKGEDILERMLLSYKNYKILTPKANGNETYKPNAFIIEPNTYVTETFLIVAPGYELKELENIRSYMHTRFFTFLVNQIKISHNTTKDTYRAVPVVDFSRKWTDEELYIEFGLTQEEIDHIEFKTSYIVKEESK